MQDETMHDIAVEDALYHMLYFLARVEKRRIRTILARAIEDYGKKHGMYVSTKSTLLEVCPMCKRDLNEKTVAGYLLKRGVWVCRECHKVLVRERDAWLASHRPNPSAGRAAARASVAARPTTMRDGARRAPGGPRD